MTVYVREDEWFEVGNWVYQNWDIINGVSFLPYDGGNTSWLLMRKLMLEPTKGL